MPDNRSKADKLRAVINGRGTTAGERENAQRLLDRELAKNPQPVRDRHKIRDDIFANTAARHNYSSDPLTAEDIRRTVDDMFRNDFGSFWTGSFDPGRPFRTTRDQETMAERIRRMADELDQQTRTQYSQEQQRQHDMAGVHSWAVVGTNTVGEKIQRCIICGAYEAKKRHRGNNIDDHDWVDS